MLKKIAIFIIIAVLIFIIGLYATLNSKWSLPIIIDTFVNPNLNGAKIIQWRVEEQRFRYPLRMHLGKVQFSVVNDKARSEFYLESIDLDGTKIFQNTQRILEICVKGLQAKQNSVYKIQGVDLALLVSFNPKNFQIRDGRLTADSIESNQYLLTKVSAKLSGNQNYIKLSNFRADFYKGILKGEIFLDYPKQMAYIITMNVNAVDANQMKSVNDALFSKVQGKFDGRLKAEGNSRGIRLIDAAFDAPSGSRVKASLLQYLLTYLPQSQQRRNLEALIKLDGDVPLEKTELKLQSLSEDKLQANTNLESKEFNLDIHLSVDFNIEGGLTTILNYLSKFSS